MAPIYPEAPTRWCGGGRTRSVRYTTASWMPSLEEKRRSTRPAEAGLYIAKTRHYVEKWTSSVVCAPSSCDSPVLLSLLYLLVSFVSGWETLPRHQADRACAEHRYLAFILTETFTLYECREYFQCCNISEQSFPCQFLCLGSLFRAVELFRIDQISLVGDR